MKNRYLSLECNPDELTITDNISASVIVVPWKSIGLQYENELVALKVSEISVQADSISVQGHSGNIAISVVIGLNPDQHWCTFKTTFTDLSGAHSTPDVVCLGESASLVFDAVGYKHQNAYQSNIDSDNASQSGEEASFGRIPGCGYPLFSNNFFVGIEHVAAYSLKKETGFTCKYYPAWDKNNTIIVPPVVIGVKGEKKSVAESFLQYIDKISIPKKQSPFLCACTFWSDPYIGNSEYKVNFSHYMRFIEQYIEAGIKPEMLMLDAGWNDRNSILQAKDEIGGDEGLKKVSDCLAEHNIEFGLWTSINGPMGVSPEWAERQGYPVGTGIGAAYSVPHKYMVLPDNDFADKSAERHVEILEKTNCKFFKIDWDCECATNSSFDKKYPTVDHVRTASIDAINRVHAAIIKKDLGCHIRNGWWPSPWWLKNVTLTWLAHSGDCEYSALPALTQRDRAVTHRDAMYYYIFKESQTPLPLDSVDNHELAKALRNPFAETYESWCNAIVMLYMRGTVYLSVMINAATLSATEALFFAEVKSFAEKYQHILFNKSARFFGGNPAVGEVYGFLHQTENEAVAVIRNPSVVPCRYSLSELIGELGFTPDQMLTLYPYCSAKQDQTIELLSHQVTVLYFSKELQQLPSEILNIPFTVNCDGGVYLAAGLEPNDSFGTIQEEFVIIRDLSIKIIDSNITENKKEFYLEVAVPDRMKNPTMLIELKGMPEKELNKIEMHIYHDRYPKTGDGHAVAITTLHSKRKEGYGIIQNIKPDDINQDVQYRLCNIPSGGHSFLDIILENLPKSKEIETKIYLSGKRGQSRKGKEFKLPEIFTNIPKTDEAGVGVFCGKCL